MLNRIFPAQFDNAWRGSRLAIWLLIPILLLRTVMGVNSVLFTHKIATSADGIPVDTFGPAGAQAALALFALLGFYLLTVPLLGALALIRYRTMIPLIYLLLLIQQLGGKAVSLTHPMAATAAAGAGSALTLGLLGATLLGFCLSLWRRGAGVLAPVQPEGHRPLSAGG